jgi:hypothetical protein
VKFEVITFVSKPSKYLFNKNLFLYGKVLLKPFCKR